ncbi:MAG: hypothetical protein LBS77_05515 [Desulfovibrio sp.]|jgi:hypothetical protein|nr:hypothetical protein [Desulfovibrio sp.]
MAINNTTFKGNMNFTVNNVNINNAMIPCCPWRDNADIDGGTNMGKIGLTFIKASVKQDGTIQNHMTALDAVTRKLGGSGRIQCFVRVQIDKKDASMLTHSYRAGKLTTAHVPDWAAGAASFSTAAVTAESSSSGGA